MTVVRTLAGAELRRSWRQLLGLAFVVLLGTGGVMLALSAARRADTSFDRFRTSVTDGDALVAVADSPGRLQELRDLPAVQTLAPMGYVAIYPRGAPEEAKLEGGAFASIDGQWLYDIQRPRVLVGHMPSPDAGNQMVVNEEFVTWFGARVGHVQHMEAMTVESMASQGEIDDVVSIDLTVMAVVRTPGDIGANVGGPVAYLPPGFLQAHPEVGIVQGFGLARLVGGDASFREFEQQATAILGDEPSFNTLRLTLEGRSVQRSLDVQSTALVIVALVTAASASALLMQVASRRIRLAAEASAALRSIGARRVQRVAILIGPPMIATALAVVAAAVGAVALSPLLPRGLARVAEPDPGAYADAAVLAGVGLLALLVAASMMVTIAARATRVARHQGAEVTHLGERTVARLQGMGARLPAVTGLRLALPRRGSDQRLAGFASFAGLVVGVGGLIAAAAFGAQLSHVAADSGAWGAPFDLFVEIRGHQADADGPMIAAIPGVAGVTAVQYADVVDLGDVSAQGFGVDAIKGPLAVTPVEGGAPRSNDEVLLGVRTADALGLGIGDTAAVPTIDGEPLELTIVGLGLLPIVGDGSYDTGVVVLNNTFDRLHHDDPRVSFWVDVAIGSSSERVASHISATGRSVGPISPPGEQLNLRSALTYPNAVGLIVALLAVAGLANALLSGSAARRLELATLRAIGFTGHQIRESVAWQSLSVAASALVMAVPVGFLMANTTWAAFADRLSLDRALPLPWEIAALVAAALITLATFAAVPIGGRSARRSLALDLRSE
ncbi:MAG: FtsX-like permease family protein [Microthrixaceae bacterium]